MKVVPPLPVVGVWEMVIILVAVLMFGPKRIPQIARQIGTMLAELRRTSDEFMRELIKEPIDEDDLHDKPEPHMGGEQGNGKEQKIAERAKHLTSDQIREAALNLGIDTEGKSDEEIRGEMMEKIYASPVEEED